MTKRSDCISNIKREKKHPLKRRSMAKCLAYVLSVAMFIGVLGVGVTFGTEDVDDAQPGAAAFEADVSMFEAGSGEFLPRAMKHFITGDGGVIPDTLEFKFLLCKAEYNDFDDEYVYDEDSPLFTRVNYPYDRNDAPVVFDLIPYTTEDVVYYVLKESEGSDSLWSYDSTEYLFRVEFSSPGGGETAVSVSYTSREDSHSPWGEDWIEDYSIDDEQTWPIFTNTYNLTGGGSWTPEDKKTAEESGPGSIIADIPVIKTIPMEMTEEELTNKIRNGFKFDVLIEEYEDSGEYVECDLMPSVTLTIDHFAGVDDEEIWFSKFKLPIDIPDELEPGESKTYRYKITENASSLPSGWSQGQGGEGYIIEITVEKDSLGEITVTVLEATVPYEPVPIIGATATSTHSLIPYPCDYPKDETLKLDTTELYGVPSGTATYSLYEFGISKSEGSTIKALCADILNPEPYPIDWLNDLVHIEPRDGSESALAFALWDSNNGAKMSNNDFNALFGFGTGEPSALPSVDQNVRRELMNCAVWFFEQKYLWKERDVPIPGVWDVNDTDAWPDRMIRYNEGDDGPELVDISLWGMLESNGYGAHLLQILQTLESMVNAWEDSDNKPETGQSIASLIFDYDAESGLITVDYDNEGYKPHKPALILSWAGDAEVSVNGTPISSGDPVMPGADILVTSIIGEVTFTLDDLNYHLAYNSIKGALLQDLDKDAAYDIFGTGLWFQRLITGCAHFLKQSKHITIRSENMTNIEFTNFYSPEPARWEPDVYKSSYGKDMTAGQFEFRLYEASADSSNPIGFAKVGEPIAIGTNGAGRDRFDDSSGNTPSSRVSFEDIETPEDFVIEYDYGSIANSPYTYLVYEVDKTGVWPNLGWKFDDSIFRIEVEVWDDDGVLKTTETRYKWNGGFPGWWSAALREIEDDYQFTEFENYYHTDSAYVVIEGKKLIEGRGYDENKTFWIRADEAYWSGGTWIPKGPFESGINCYQDVTGAGDFTLIIGEPSAHLQELYGLEEPTSGWSDGLYPQGNDPDDPKVYYFLISEEEKGPDDLGWSYSEIQYLIKVVVIDEGQGSAVAEITGTWFSDDGHWYIDDQNLYEWPEENISDDPHNSVFREYLPFINKFEPTPTSWTPTVYKYTNGKAMESGQFIFTVWESDEEGTEVEEIGKMSNTDPDPAYHGDYDFCSEVFFNDGPDEGKIVIHSPGTHYYLIKENYIDPSTGWLYDKTVFSIEIEATLDTNPYSDTYGGLVVMPEMYYTMDEESGIREEYQSQFALFVNTYGEEASGSLELDGTKEIAAGSSGTLSQGQFSFTIYEDGNHLETVTNNGDGSIRFSTIDYTSEGEHVYVISEVISSLPSGWKFVSGGPYTIYVKVTDNGEGELIPTAYRDPLYEDEIELDYIHEFLVFVNEYEATGSIGLDGKKVATGGALTAGMFSFRVTDEHGYEVSTGTNDADGNITFLSPIEFAEAGQYEFEVSEVTTSLPPGWSLVSDNPIKLYVDVEDDGYGELTATVYSDSGYSNDITYDLIEYLVFENKYEEEAPGETNAEIKVKKVIQGNSPLPVAGLFRFALLDENGIVIALAENDVEGFVTFIGVDELEYDAEGMHTYTVVECGLTSNTEDWTVGEPAGTAPNTYQTSDGGGWTYHAGSYEITISVGNGGSGNLVATVTYPGNYGVTAPPIFTNTYMAASTNATLNVTKSVAGTAIPTTWSFGVGLYEYDGVDEKDVTYGGTGTKIGNDEEVANGAATATFTVPSESAEYEAAGTYYYIMKETGLSGAGWIVDDAVYLAKVAVTDEDGELTAEVTYHKWVEDNSEGAAAGAGAWELFMVDSVPATTAAFMNTAYSMEGSLTLFGTKAALGSALKNGQFDFEIREGSTPVSTGSNLANGTIEFTPILYTAEGKHVYVVSEIGPAPSGWESQTSPITIYVDVVDVGGNGTLVATVYSDAQNSVKVENENIISYLTFTNEYTAVGELALSGIKTLAGEGIPAGTHVFGFTVREWDEDAKAYKVITTGSSSSSSGGAIVFDPITYGIGDKGRHVYEITENSPGAVWTATTGTLKLYVEVLDNEDGTLSAIVYEDADFTTPVPAEDLVDYLTGYLVFVNNYVGGINISVEVDKDTIKRTSAAFDGTPANVAVEDRMVNNVGLLEEHYRYDINFRSTSNVDTDEFVVEDPLESVAQGYVRLEALWTPATWGDKDGRMNVWYKTARGSGDSATVPADAAAITKVENPQYPTPVYDATTNRQGWKLWTTIDAANDKSRIDELGMTMEELWEAYGVIGCKALSVRDLNLSNGDYITALRFEFGAVKVGFTSKNNGSNNKQLNTAIDGSDSKAPFRDTNGSEDYYKSNKPIAGIIDNPPAPVKPLAASLPFAGAVMAATESMTVRAAAVDDVPEKGTTNNWTPKPGASFFPPDTEDGAKLMRAPLEPAAYLMSATKPLGDVDIVSSVSALIGLGGVGGQNDDDQDAVLTRVIEPFTTDPDIPDIGGIVDKRSFFEQAKFAGLTLIDGVWFDAEGRRASMSTGDAFALNLWLVLFFAALVCIVLLVLTLLPGRGGKGRRKKGVPIAMILAIALLAPSGAYANEAPPAGAVGGTLQVEYRYAEGGAPDIPQEIQRFGFTYRLVSVSDPIEEGELPTIRRYTYRVDGALTPEQLEELEGLGDLTLTPVDIVVEEEVDKIVTIPRLPTNDVDEIPKEMKFTVTSGTDPGGFEDKVFELTGVSFELASPPRDSYGRPAGYTATAVYRGVQSYLTIGYYLAEAVFTTYEEDDDGTIVYVVVASYETDEMLPLVDEEFDEPEPIVGATDDNTLIGDDIVALQSGNPIMDLVNGLVPLGGMSATGVWSFLSLLFSFAAIGISLALGIGALFRKRRMAGLAKLGVHDETWLAKVKRRGILLRVLTIIVGLITLVSWLILDNFSHGMVWVNSNTPLIGLMFAATVGLFALINARDKKYLSDDQNEGNRDKDLAVETMYA